MLLDHEPLWCFTVPLFALRVNTINVALCKCAGVVRGDKLLLVPVDNALQLRPSLAHLDKPAATPGAPAAGVPEAAEEEDVKPELQAVKVTLSLVGQVILLMQM
jgi:RPC5 protein